MVNTLPKNGYNQFQAANLSEHIRSSESNSNEYIDLSEITESQAEFESQTRKIEAVAIAIEMSNDANLIVSARQGHLAALDFQAEE